MIQTEIKVTGLELTPAIKDYIEAKILQLDKLVDSSAGGVLAQVEVGKTTEHHRRGEVFKAEINLQMNGKLLTAKIITEDLYASLDKVKDELARQITSVRNKEKTLFRHGARRFKNLLRGWGK